MLNRRQFLRNMALVAIGAAAMPEQITALENIFNVNSPNVEKGLIYIDDICIGGLAHRSTPVIISISDKVHFAMNLFGGIVRWVGTPEGRIITRLEDIDIKVDYRRDLLEEEDYELFSGSVFCIDQELKRKKLDFNSNDLTLKNPIFLEKVVIH